MNYNASLEFGTPLLAAFLKPSSKPGGQVEAVATARAHPKHRLKDASRTVPRLPVPWRRRGPRAAVPAFGYDKRHTTAGLFDDSEDQLATP